MQATQEELAQNGATLAVQLELEIQLQVCAKPLYPVPFAREGWGLRARPSKLGPPRVQATLLVRVSLLQGAREELAQKGSWIEKLNKELEAARAEPDQNAVWLKQAQLEVEVCASHGSIFGCVWHN